MEKINFLDDLTYIQSFFVFGDLTVELISIFAPPLANT